MKHLSLFLALLLLLTCLAGCDKDPLPTEPAGTGGSTDVTLPSTEVSFQQTDDTMFTERDFRTAPYEGRVVNVTLNGDTATADSNAVQIKGSTVKITEEATYVFTGSYNGMIVVNCEKSARPQLVFNGVSIYSETSAALYVMQAERVTVTLTEGTDNYLSNGGAFEAIDSEEIDAALYSRRDLVINGSGKLTVLSPAGKGISCKDNLILTGGTLDIQSAFHGLDANDSLRITGISATVAAGMDGIHCENNTDTDFGYVYISSGTFDIDAAGDGIAAGAWLQITDGSFTLLTGSGHENGKDHADNWGGFPGGPGGKATTDTDSASMKGIKAATGRLLSGGSYTIDSADDALHCDSATVIRGGSYTIATGDDAIHAETALTIADGSIDISTSYEGLEAQDVAVLGGSIKLVATDDGINSAGGNDNSGNGGRDEMAPPPGGNPPPGGHGGMGGPGGMPAGNGTVLIAGGTLYIKSSGDGIDANGSVTITGGHTTIVGPTQRDTATLDFDRSCIITGGTFIGTGSTMMAQTFSEGSTQGVFAVTCGSQQAGSAITLQNAAGETVIDYTPDLPFGLVILSSADIVAGEIYTITVGQTSGTFEAN